ncbi:MAG: hypothetical protein AB7S74_13635 [Hyphomicrobium sp.]
MSTKRHTASTGDVRSFAPAFSADVILNGARQPRSDPVKAEQAVMSALAAEPNDLSVRLAAYRFFFYSHRFSDALIQADVIIRLAARRLNVAGDWEVVSRSDAPFDQLEEAPGLYLQALLAWGYCAVRIGQRAEGSRAIAKVAELDPGDRFGAGRLLNVIDAHVLTEDD